MAFFLLLITIGLIILGFTFLITGISNSTFKFIIFSIFILEIGVMIFFIPLQKNELLFTSHTPEVVSRLGGIDLPFKVFIITKHKEYNWWTWKYFLWTDKVNIVGVHKEEGIE